MWLYRYVVVLICGCVGVWTCGNMGMWGGCRYVGMSVWECGYMGI